MAVSTGESARVGDFVRQNYREVREQRGLSWEQMAERFRKDGLGDLEAWALEEARLSDRSARATRNDVSKAIRPPRARG